MWGSRKTDRNRWDSFVGQELWTLILIQSFRRESHWAWEILPSLPLPSSPDRTAYKALFLRKGLGASNITILSIPPRPLPTLPALPPPTALPRVSIQLDSPFPVPWLLLSSLLPGLPWEHQLYFLCLSSKNHCHPTPTKRNIPCFDSTGPLLFCFFGSEPGQPYAIHSSFGAYVFSQVRDLTPSTGPCIQEVY